MNRRATCDHSPTRGRARRNPKDWKSRHLGGFSRVFHIARRRWESSNEGRGNRDVASYFACRFKSSKTLRRMQKQCEPPTDSKPAACRGGKLPRQAALSPFPGCRCAARAIPGDDEPPRRPYGSGFPFPRRSGAMGAVRATRPRYALLRFRPFTSLHCCDPAISSAHIIFTHDSSDVFRVPGCQCRSPSL